MTSGTGLARLGGSARIARPTLALVFAHRVQPAEVARKLDMPKLLEANKLRIQVSESVGEVSALLASPRGARSLVVLAHGAGAA